MLSGFDFKLLSLSDYNILPCDGCGSCARTKKCVLKDDCEKLFKELSGADVIVIGSPVHRLSSPATFRALVERTSILFLREELWFGKTGGVVCIGRPMGSGKVNVAEELTSFLLSMGVAVVPPIVFGNAHTPGEIEKDKIAHSSLGLLAENLNRYCLKAPN